MKKYHIEPERKFPNAAVWFGWFCFLILFAGFLAQAVQLQDTRAELKGFEIAKATAAMAPEPIVIQPEVPKKRIAAGQRHK